MDRSRLAPGSLRTSSVSRAAALGVGVSTAFALASCGGGIRMEPRFVALTNTMAAMGMAQSGGIQQGSLGRGEEAATAVDLTAGECVTFVALGEDGTTNIDLVVRDESGQELARDGTVDAQAATQFCAPRTASYQVVVVMADGSGGYLSAAWRGQRTQPSRAPGAGDPGAAVAQGGPGTCEDPWPLVAGEPRTGDTTGGDATMTASCISGSAPERVYSFVLTERSLVTAEVRGSFDTAVYILGECGNTRSELACNDDAESPRHSLVSVTLEPGTYSLVVDGWGAGRGEYEVSYTTATAPMPAQICRDATPLTPGEPIAGTTTGAPDVFQGRCAGNGTERLYSLDIAQRSRVRVQLDSTHDGTLYMRSSCMNPASEVACNDDAGSVRRSLITATVDPGRYYVFADGWRGSGDFTLRAEVGPAAGSGAPGDTCASAVPYQPGVATRIDTIGLADDLSGSCGGRGAPDHVYRLDVQRRARLQASFGRGTDLAGVMYLQRTCGDATTEIACTTSAARGAIDETLAPGTYYLVVDGESGDSFGVAELSINLVDLDALAQVCRSAPLLRPGTQTRGDTSSSSDRFQASCAGGARSADLVYRLEIRRRSFVRIASEQTGFDGALYLRRDCLDMSSELGCNDDVGDTRHSMVETTLDRGTYYVFVDGWASGNQGPFTLDVDVQPL